MDVAFDQFEAGKSVASGRGRTGSKDPGFTPKNASASEENLDSLDGALSVLEGAIDQLDLESLDAKADAAPDPTSEVVSDLTSLTEILRRRDKKVADATTKLRRTIAGALLAWATEVGADDIARDMMGRVREGFDVVPDHTAAGTAPTKARRAAEMASRNSANKASEKVRRAANRKTTRKTTTREKTVRKKE